MKNILWYILVFISFEYKIHATNPYVKLAWTNNWCFMDAALYCLAGADDFVNGLKEELHKYSLEERQDMWEYILYRTLKYIRKGNNSPDENKTLYRKLGEKRLIEFNQWTTSDWAQKNNYLGGLSSKQFLKNYPQAIFHRQLYTDDCTYHSTPEEKSIIMGGSYNLVFYILKSLRFENLKEAWMKEYFLYKNPPKNNSWNKNQSLTCFPNLYEPFALKLKCSTSGEMEHYDNQPINEPFTYFDTTSGDFFNDTTPFGSNKKPYCVGVFNNYILFKAKPTLINPYPYDISLPHKEVENRYEFANYELFAMYLYKLSGIGHAVALVRNKDNNGNDVWHFYDGLFGSRFNVSKDEIFKILKGMPFENGSYSYGCRPNDHILLFYCIKKNQQNQLATLQQLLIQLKVKLTQLIKILAKFKK